MIHKYLFDENSIDHIGGGYKMEGATVMILEKRKEELRVRVLDAKGETLLDITV